MKFIFIRETRHDTSKIRANGSTLKLLTFLTIISKLVIEKIIEDYGVGYNTALKVVTNSITESVNTVKEVEDKKC